MPEVSSINLSIKNFLLKGYKSLENWDPQRASTHDLFRGMQLSLQAAMAEPMTQVKYLSHLNLVYSLNHLF